MVQLIHRELREANLDYTPRADALASLATLARPKGTAGIASVPRYVAIKDIDRRIGEVSLG